MSQFNIADAHKVLGERLRVIRKAGNRTINDVAAHIGIGSETLSKIEDGQIDFGILVLGKLCKGYDVSLEKLLEGFDFKLRK